MGVEEEVIDIRNQLDKISKGDKECGNALDLLNQLGDLKVNLSILTHTRIGMTVNNLRKTSKDEEVVLKSKSLIKLWKKFVPPENNSGGGGKKEESGADKGKKDEDRKKSSSSGGGDSSAGAASFPPKQNLATSDDVRLRCREMLTNALKGNGDMPDGTSKPCDEIADIVENCIFKNYKNQTNPKYKNQIRSRVFNLRDKKNPALRENLLTGQITPEKFAVMTSDEMASDEVKAVRQAFVKEGIDAAQLAQVQGTKTDLLKCGKCGKRNCTYNQIQTRSADEPMTTFVLCNECGNRWKFC